MNTAIGYQNFPTTFVNWGDLENAKRNMILDKNYQCVKEKTVLEKVDDLFYKILTLHYDEIMYIVSQQVDCELTEKEEEKFIRFGHIADEQLFLMRIA